MAKKVWDVNVTYYGGHHEQEGYTEKYYCETSQMAIMAAYEDFKEAEGIEEDEIEDGDFEFEFPNKAEYTGFPFDASFQASEFPEVRVDFLGTLDLNDPRVIALFQPFDGPEFPDPVLAPT